MILGRILGPLLKNGLPLIGNVLKPLASVLIPLWLTTPASATDAAIHKNIFGSSRALDLASRNRPLIISNNF